MVICLITKYGKKEWNIFFFLIHQCRLFIAINVGMTLNAISVGCINWTQVRIKSLLHFWSGWLKKYEQLCLQI